MWTKFLRLFFPCLVKEPKRARYMDGRLKGDDKKTPKINEAWEGGKAPNKTTAKKKTTKKKTTKKASD